MIDKIGDIAKRRGIVYPSYEIYGGLRGLIDYGPVGARIKDNLEKHLRDTYILGQSCMEVQCPTLGPKSLWEASGHVGSFADLMTECEKCGTPYRADHLIEKGLGIKTEGKRPEELDEHLAKLDCGKCHGRLSKAYDYNLMFATSMGPGKNKVVSYLRPETAQSTYSGFKRLWEYARKRLPFGVMQIGRSYRNEISPRQGMIRLREFNQAEIQFFMDPTGVKAEGFDQVADISVRILDKNDDESELTLGKAVSDGLITNDFIAYQLGVALTFYSQIGLDTCRLSLRQHRDDERAFYSSDTWDVEFASNGYGAIELVGVADRGDYDLSQHSIHSKQELQVNIEGRKFIPHVIEVAYGIDRPIYCLLESCLTEEDDRTYFRFPDRIAPYLACVLPLVKKDGIPEKAREVFDMLRTEGIYSIQDKAGSIGKRYARADEIGIPYAITIDYDTIKDDSVTLRFRDSKEQERLRIDEVIGRIRGSR
ncbi:glycine--tRNA ligase [Candidatus Altiarchaeota archaeon]